MGIKKVILDAVGDRMMAQSDVSSVTTLSEQFRLITLRSNSFLPSKWTPGDKIQLDTGGWELRTYTPIAVENGELSIVAFLPGQGPGSAWAAQVTAGQKTRVFGPNSSIKGRPDHSILLFGDETSVGLAAALVRTTRVIAAIECANVEENKALLTKLGVNEVSCWKTASDGSHLHSIAEVFWKAAEQGTFEIILTGRAASIAQIRGILKTQPSPKIKVRAYWAEGKKGMD